MKKYRTLVVVLVVFSTLILCGFKKPTKTHKKLKQKSTSTEQHQQKPLDLALPSLSQSIQSASLGLKTLPQDDTVSPQLFNSDRAQSNSMEMKGQVIMSQEPEAEKRKSADGAGIMINIHH